MKGSSAQNLSLNHKYPTKPDTANYSTLYCPKYVPKSTKGLKVQLNDKPTIKIEESTNLKDDIDDELSEHLSLNFSKEESLKNPIIINGLIPNGTIYPSTPIPYCSNIHDNPFSRGRACSDFFSAVKAIQEEEQNRNLSLSPGLLKLAQHSYNDHLALKTPLVFSTSNSLKENATVDKAHKLIDCLKTLEILEKILCFLGPGDILNVCKISSEIKSCKSIVHTAKNTLKRRIIKGLIQNDQIDYWKHFVQFGRVKHINPCVFINMALRESKFNREISKDVDRTLPDSGLFKKEKGKLALYRVLIAISNTERELGYIQGLNSVVGTLLLYLKEEDAYWMALYLLRNRQIRKVFIPPFIKTEIWNYQLEIFMQNYLPDLYQHLTYKGLSIGYFSTPWFMTLFSHFFKSSIVIKIWDLFLLLGEKVIIQISLAIFLYHKDALMRKDVDDLGAFFSTNLRKISSDEELIKLALDFKVTKRLLNQIEGYYHKETRSRKLILQCDRENPLKISFYELLKPESKKEVPKTDDTDEMPRLLLPDGDSENLLRSLSENKDSESRKSLRGLLSKENSYPNVSTKKTPLSAFSQKNSALSPKFLSEKNRKINDSQNFEIEDLHNISQSTETQTQKTTNLTKGPNSTLFNSPQTLVWKKYEDTESYAMKKKLDSEEYANLLVKVDEHAGKTDYLENEIHAQKIPCFGYVEQFLQKNEIKSPRHHLRKRSNSYVEFRTQFFSPFAKEKSSIHPFTAESNSSSFLTEKPDGMENGYFDEEIKEELQRETEVFSPKANGNKLETQNFSFKTFEKEFSK